MKRPNSPGAEPGTDPDTTAHRTAAPSPTESATPEPATSTRPNQSLPPSMAELDLDEAGRERLLVDLQRSVGNEEVCDRLGRTPDRQRRDQDR